MSGPADFRAKNSFSDTSSGAFAAKWYADMWNATHDPAYLLAGELAALWMPDTYLKTFGTLSAGLGVGTLASALSGTGIGATEGAIGAAADNATSDAEFLFNSWDNGTFPNRTQSILYHYAEHGSGQGYAGYTQEALNFLDQNWESGQAIVLRNGETGIKIVTDDFYGIYTSDGRIISYGPR